MGKELAEVTEIFRERKLKLLEFTICCCLSENPSWPFCVPKMTFLSEPLRKQHIKKESSPLKNICQAK